MRDFNRAAESGTSLAAISAESNEPQPLIGLQGGGQS